MNILLIGNGFDVAHELPTKYTDFLGFVYVIEDYIRSKKKTDIIDTYEKNVILKNFTN